MNLKILTEGESAVDNSIHYKVYLDIKAASRPINTDIYFVLIDPHRNFYSAPDWMPGILPYIQNIAVLLKNGS